MTWIMRGGILIGLMYGSLVAKADQSPRALYVMDVDGSNRQDISPRSELRYGSACFSHDGRYLAFDAWPANQSYSQSRVYLMKTDGTDLKDFGSGAFPSWSPDDKKIVFRTHAGPRNIVVVNADGSGEEELSLSGNSPRWSPDGRYIALLDSRANAISIYDAARGSSETVTGLGLTAYWGGCWSSEGKRYCFPARSQFAVPDALVIVEFDEGMQVEAKTVRFSGPEIGTNMSWSRRGGRFCFLVVARNRKSISFTPYLQRAKTNRYGSLVKIAIGTTPIQHGRRMEDGLSLRRHRE